jgi:hypothetical protein
MQRGAAPGQPAWAWLAFELNRRDEINRRRGRYRARGVDSFDFGRTLCYTNF